MRRVTRQIRRLLRPDSGCWAVGLRAALIVSLWHAPIPWVHFHDLEGPQVEQLETLSQHVAEFHAGEVGHGLTALDWHAHLVLPWSLHQHDTCPEDEHAPRPEGDCLVMLAGSAISQLSLSLGRPIPAALAGPGDAIASSPLALPEVVAAATIPPGGLCRHFFETYGPSIAVRDLVGVQIC